MSKATRTTHSVGGDQGGGNRTPNKEAKSGGKGKPNPNNSSKKVPSSSGK